MRNAITPIVSIILLLVMTVGASAAAYIWMSSIQTNVQEGVGANIEGNSMSSCSQLQLISLRGDEVVVQNVGCDAINQVTVLINNVLTNYDLIEPLTPGDATTITFTAGRLDEELKVVVALSNGVTSGAIIENCTESDGCTNLEETFEEHSLLADVADDADWTNVGDQDADANATIVLRDGDQVALFMDNGDPKIADKTYAIPIASPGSGNSTIKLNADFSNPGKGSRTMTVVFYDGSSTPIQLFVWGNGLCAVIEPPTNLRIFYTAPGGGGTQVSGSNPITHEGKHDWTFTFNEDDETIRYFIDGVEIFANDGVGGTFDSYFQPAGAIASLEFATGTPIALGGFGTEENTVFYLDDINFDWI